MRISAFFLTCALLMPESATRSAPVAESRPQVAQAQNADSQKDDVREVRVMRPHRGEISREITLPGTLRANQQATLYAKVAGYLKTISVDRGDRVQAGQLLAEIEVPELLADLAKNKAELKVAEVEMSRLSAAQQKAPDLVLPQAVDAGVARLEVAKAAVQRTETLLQYSRLSAPFTGIVTARFVDPGAFVPAATSGSTPQSAAVLTLADFQTVRAQVALPETEAAFARTGQPVRLSLEALPGRTFTGSISRLAYALDEATRTMLIEADLPNPDLLLRPGMFATCRIVLEQHRDALLIPAQAVLHDQAGPFVLIATNALARRLPIKTGLSDDKRVEVLQGLAGDELVIAAGTAGLKEGQKLKLVETE